LLGLAPITDKKAGSLYTLFCQWTFKLINQLTERRDWKSRVLRIRDVEDLNFFHPGSIKKIPGTEFFPPRIPDLASKRFPDPDPHAIKECKISEI
jgi:hypothetical protein